MAIIQGELLFEGGYVALDGAAVYIRLMDVSHVDAAARTIAEYHINSLPAGSASFQQIPFALKADVQDSSKNYVLAAHIDLNGDGKVSIGDYITMESFPVSVGSPTTHLVIRVRRVEG